MVPAALKDSHYQSTKQLGRGVGYRYPHDFPGHFIPQAYLPEYRLFYQPSDQGDEKKIAEDLKVWRNKNSVKDKGTR